MVIRAYFPKRVSLLNCYNYSGPIITWNMKCNYCSGNCIKKGWYKQVQKYQYKTCRKYQQLVYIHCIYITEYDK